MHGNFIKYSYRYKLELANFLLHCNTDYSIHLCIFDINTCIKFIAYYVRYHDQELLDIEQALNFG